MLIGNSAEMKALGADSAVADVSVKQRPTFVIFCSVFGVLAFAQLVLVGVALANRVGETRVVEVEKLGESRVVYIPTIADAPPEVGKQKPRSYEDILKAYGDAKDVVDYQLAPQLKSARRASGIEISPELSSSASRFLPIKNSRVEKLVSEARGLHLAGDVVRAVVKLEEAEIIAPKEPAIIYRRALIFEDMRNWERAGDEYDKLFALGPEIGEYYDIATDKIANGVKDAPDVVPFQLGNVVQRVNSDKLGAKLVVPVRKLTEREIEPSQIDVRIFFYDIVDNKEVQPVPQQREENIQKRWIANPADWIDNNEESAEAIYQLPTMELADVHLFGERRYFGYVVELYYKGELMDQSAYPGRLHGIHARDQYKQQIDSDFVPLGVLPELQGLDSEGMLLPSLKE